MRVAALYDIHGNLPALEAVLVDLPNQDVDAIVIGGDIVWGPMPAETLDLLRALHGDVRWVRGNADREVAAVDPEERDASGLDLVTRITHWTADALDSEQRAFLRALPLTTSIDVEDLGPVLFCHATPRSDEEIVTSLAPDDVVTEALAPASEDVIVCGHTHAQFDRRVGTKRFVNAGSVGMPYENRPGAYWTLLGPGVNHMRTEYDLDDAADRIRAGGAPEVEALIASLREPPDQRAAARQQEARAGR
ncbi:MAG TPA: metallophosphoesterase family protein [Actinomycetota bacterium]|nr:metallophosphoesterase family protein [Actinomycetota bacterium]